MTWRIVTPPEAEPVELDQLWDQLRLEPNDQNSLLLRYITTARQHVEVTCNRALMPQTWEFVRGGFPEGEMRLPGGNVTGINSVSYYAPDGVQQVLAASEYRLMQAPPARVVRTGDSWPLTRAAADAVAVEYDVGYADAESVPGALKDAIILLAATWFENRTAVNIGNITSTIPMSVEYLLFPYRDMGVI